MGVQISTLGIVVSGQLTRKFDGTNTTLEVTLAQAAEINQGTSKVLEFFGTQGINEPVQHAAPAEDPNQISITEALDPKAK